ncbi:MAG: DNA ligase D [Theionarchaea archaeon]|nr:DNA ligase D [Theionarchaea archaeon]
MGDWPLWPTKPMLAQVCDSPFSHPDWLYEVKWDGVRCLMHISKGKIRLQARSLKDITHLYPELAGAADLFDARVAVIDGEIVALDDEGKASFSRLSNRMHLKSKPDIDSAAGSIPVTFYAFDLLYLNGSSMVTEDLGTRKATLKSIIGESSGIRYSDHVEEDGLEFFDAAKKMGLEGVMAKRKDGKYESGTRSSAWLKIRINIRDDFVIGGWTPGSGGRRMSFGALLLGQHAGGMLHYVGKVGTGFNRKLLGDIRNRLEELESDHRPFLEDPGETGSRWIRPELVCEVKLAERSPEGLRFPVFLGMRMDKSPLEVTVPEEALAKEENRHSRFERVSLSNPDKIFWPDVPLKKRDLFEYYLKMAEFILPHLRNRPLTLLRQPNGINGKKFYQRNKPDFAPEWVESRMIIRDDHAPINSIICQDKETLAWLANLGCIELNPWTSRADEPDRPDFIVFDLDPVHPARYADSCEIALALREVLDEVGFRSYIKTSGKRGLHLYIPIRRELTFAQARSFSGEVGRHLVPKFPDMFTMSRRADDKRGRVFFDPAQQGWGKSLASPYSLRPTPMATVSTPITWKEAESCVSPEKFDMRTVPGRLRVMGDPWRRLLRDFQGVDAVLGA